MARWVGSCRSSLGQALGSRDGPDGAGFNAYLSQVERGMHAPSLRVMRALADVLEVPVEDLVHLSDSDEQRASSRTPSHDVESAIKRLAVTEAQQRSVLGVYRSYVDKPPGE